MAGFDRGVRQRSGVAAYGAGLPTANGLGARLPCISTPLQRAFDNRDTRHRLDQQRLTRTKKPGTLTSTIATQVS